MPDMQSSTSPAAAGMPVVIETLLRPEDCDFALGCECAYPALQIERWSQEERAATGENG
jgi:hypothetical protein